MITKLSQGKKWDYLIRFFTQILTGSDNFYNYLSQSKERKVGVFKKIKSI